MRRDSKMTHKHQIVGWETESKVCSRLSLLDDEPIFKEFLLTMSTKKRSLSSEDDCESPEKFSEELTTPTDSPQSKKRRHSSSHSENEQLTQILDEENDRLNGKKKNKDKRSVETQIRLIFVSSFRSIDRFVLERRKWKRQRAKRKRNVNFRSVWQRRKRWWKRRRKKKRKFLSNFFLFVEFRYDGTVLCHIRLPCQRRQFEIHSTSTFIRTFSWRIFVRQLISEDKFSVYIEPKPKILPNNWSIFGTAEITLIHPKDSKKNLTRSILSLIFVFFFSNVQFFIAFLFFSFQFFIELLVFERKIGVFEILFRSK